MKTIFNQGSCKRQLKTKFASFAIIAFRPGLAAHCLNEFFADRQPDPRSLFIGPAGYLKVTFKYPAEV